MAHAENSTKRNDYFSRLGADSDDGTEFIDHWDTGELLLLASSVLRSDRNWVSVTRSIKPFGEQTRPPDWYTPKNCALQYTKLLGEIEEDSKKKTVPRTERETSEVMLVKSLTERRLIELAWLNQQTKVTANILKTQLEMVENGEIDDHLEDLIKQIDEQEKREVDNYHEYLFHRDNLNTAKKLNKSRVIKGKATVRTIEPRKSKTFSEMVEETPILPISLDNIKTEIEDDEYCTPKPAVMKTKIESPHLSALLDNKVTPTPPSSPSLSSFLRTIVNSPLKEVKLDGRACPSNVEENKKSDIFLSPSKVGGVSPLLTSLLKSAAPPTALGTAISHPSAKEDELPRRNHPDPSSSPLLNSLLKNSPSVPIGSPSKEVSVKTSLAQAFNAAVAQQGIHSSNLPRFLHQPSSPDGKKSISPSSSACQSAPYLSKLLEMPLSTPGRLPPLPVLDMPSVSPAVSDTSPKVTIQSPSLTTPSKMIDLNVVIKTEPASPENELATLSEDNNSKDPISVESGFQSVGIKIDVLSDEEKLAEEVIPSIVIKQEPEIKTEIPAEDIHLEEVYVDNGIEVPAEEVTSVSIDTLLDSKPTILEEEKLIVNQNNSEKNQTTSKDLEEMFWDADSSTPVFFSPKTQEEEKNNPSESEENSSISTPTTTISIQAAKEQKITIEKNQELKEKSSNTKFPPAKKPRLCDKTELSEDEMPLSARRGRKAKKGRGRPPKIPKVEDGEIRDQYEFSDTTDDNLLETTSSNTVCYMPRQKDEDTKDSEDGNLSSSVDKRGLQVKNKQGRKTLFMSDEDRTSDWLTSDDTSSHVLSEDKLKKWEESCGKKAEQAKASSDDTKVFSTSSKSSESVKRKSQQGKRAPLPKGITIKKERKLSGMDSEEMSACSRDSDDVSRVWTKDSSDGKNTPMDVELETSSSLAAESDIEKITNESEVPFSPPSSHTGGKQDWFQAGSPKSSENISQSSEESEYESDNWDSQSVSTNKSTTALLSPYPRLSRKERESPQYKAWKKAISIVHREISCHKYANVFLQKVTNDVAPGYLSIVNCPMDLSLIKKNIDSGVINTTKQFTHDVMLMFQNAIMYNSSDHDVYHMAVEMQRDVLEQIQNFLTTQSTGVENPGEQLTYLRGSRKSVKGKLSIGSIPRIKEEPIGD